jgi:hypothetical protein
VEIDADAEVDGDAWSSIGCVGVRSRGGPKPTSESNAACP